MKMKIKIKIKIKIKRKIKSQKGVEKDFLQTMINQKKKMIILKIK